MEHKLKQIMAKVFDTPIENICENTSIDNLENWDSLRHMYMVVALEEEFKVEFTNEQVTEMLNYQLIFLTLQGKEIN